MVTLWNKKNNNLKIKKSRNLSRISNIFHNNKHFVLNMGKSLFAYKKCFNNFVKYKTFLQKCLAVDHIKTILKLI